MKLASLLLIVAFLSACAGKAVEPNYYLMRSNENLQTRELNPSADFSMGSVIIASYIDQPGLLMETPKGGVHSARQHLWAEPAYEGIRNILMIDIAHAKGEDLLPATVGNTAITLDIRIDQLHGTNDGKATLVAYWWLRRDKEVLSAYQFAEEQALTADGYAALLAAEEALLHQLGKKIAATLVVPTDS